MDRRAAVEALEAAILGARIVSPQDPGVDALVIPSLVTDRLLLRGFRRSDVADYAALNADPEVQRYIVGVGGQLWDGDRSWRHLAFLVGHWRLAGAGMWAVEHRETGAFLGVIGFAGPAGWPGFELAWKLARHAWGHGYATEGARAALAYAFNVLGKDRVISLIHPENRASIRVAERIGERLEGHADLFGRQVLCYGIDRETYRRHRAADIAVDALEDGAARSEDDPEGPALTQQLCTHILCQCGGDHESHPLDR